MSEVITFRHYYVVEERMPEQPEGISLKDYHAHLRLAYELADETQYVVYVVWNPETKSEYQDKLPYVVTEEMANGYEKKCGEKVTPRVNLPPRR
jgi:hypothetical protein